MQLALGNARFYRLDVLAKCTLACCGYPEEDMISLTDNAANKVKRIQQDEGLEAQGLRLRVIGGGCSGFSYDLFFDDQVNEDIDEQFTSHGIPLYVDVMSFTYLDGTEIDYVEGLYGAGFKFNNPTAKSTCGCGSSFSV